MANGIIIPTQQADSDMPSIVERKSWVGAAWGELAGSIGGAIIGTLAFPIAGPILGLVSGTIGGFLLGKSSGDKIAQEELKTGKKEVKLPSFWNWKLAKGYVLGSAISVGTTLIAFTGVPGTGILRFVGALAPLTGIIYGGVKGKEEMEVAYNHARQIEIAAIVEKTRPLQPAQGINSSLAPAQLPQEASQSDTKKFTQQEDARRTISNIQTTGVGI